MVAANAMAVVIVAVMTDVVAVAAVIVVPVAAAVIVVPVVALAVIVALVAVVVAAVFVPVVLAVRSKVQILVRDAVTRQANKIDRRAHLTRAGINKLNRMV